MPFSPDLKTRMFLRCERHCCLCLKQCAVNIEAAHIVAESEGGSNDEENGIPLCFDCHAAVGH
jgi:HNH endonuclease